jgi:hypothetical protein
MTVCRNVLAIAERSDDKLLVLEVLKRYPTQDGLNLAASPLSDKDLQGRRVRRSWQSAVALPWNRPNKPKGPCCKCLNS